MQGEMSQDEKLTVCLSVYEYRSPEIWQKQSCLIFQVNFV